MRILILGAGKIGSSIVRHMCHEDHEVVVIDNDPKVIENLVNQYDVMGITGNGCNAEILRSAGADRTDLAISVTDRDEANMFSSLLCKKLGVKNTIARVRDYDYVRQTSFLQTAFGINMIINPEFECAKEIMRIINFPEALHVDSFSQGNVDLVELYVKENSPLIGLSLIELNAKYKLKMLVCAVNRNGKIIIPDGQFVLEAKDRIHVTTDKYNSRLLIDKLELFQTKIKDVLILGGGRVSLYLANLLLNSRYRVKIIEIDQNVCEELSKQLPGATIICGDATDQDLLNEEGIADSDAVICLTGLDEENIIESMYAAKSNVKKVITKINKNSLRGLMGSIEMCSVISTQDVTADIIVSYIRATSNLTGNRCKTVYKFANNQAEAAEFEATLSCECLDKPLRELNLRQGILIAGIIRDGEIIIPTGATAIKENDSVIVVTKDKRLKDLDDILER